MDDVAAAPPHGPSRRPSGTQRDDVVREAADCPFFPSFLI